MSRNIKFANHYIYHVYNRGTRKNKIFLDEYDYVRWKKLLFWCANYDYPYSLYINRRKQFQISGGNLKEFDDFIKKHYRYDLPLVEIVAYTEMPNHYHLVLEQSDDEGVSKFMHKLSTSYTMFFNQKYEVTGSLFEGRFKAVMVKTDEQLLQLLRYVLVNPLAGGLISKDRLFYYSWFSLRDYGNRAGIVSQRRIPDFFKNRQELEKFLLVEFEEREIEEVRGVTIDDDFSWFLEEKETKKLMKKERVAKLSSIKG